MRVLVRFYKQVDQTIWVLLAILFAYISLVPFYYFQSQSLDGPPVFSLVKYLPFILAGSACFLWCFDIVKYSKPVLQAPINRLLGLYLVVALLSLLGANYALTGLSKWGYYNITGGVLCLLVVQYCTSWQVIRRAAFFMALLCGCAVSYTFFYAITGHEPLWDAVQRMYSPYHTRHRAMGPFGHTVATATYAMLLLPLAVWTLSVLQRMWLKIGWGLVCTLFVPVVLLTQTRGTQVATLLCCLLMGPWLKKLGPMFRRVGRSKFYGGLVVVSVVVGLGVLSQNAKVGSVLQQVEQRWKEALQTRSVTIRGDGKVYEYGSLLEYTERFRIAQYYTVGNILAEHPLLGVGFGTFTREFERYRYSENYMVREFPEHTTENMYLMFLAETGILGLISRLILMVAIFFVVLRAWLRAVDGAGKDLLWAYLVGYISLAVNMLTWDILNEPTMRMTHWLWTGLALGLVRCGEGLGVSVVEAADDAV